MSGSNFDVTVNFAALEQREFVNYYEHCGSGAPGAGPLFSSLPLPEKCLLYHLRITRALPDPYRKI